MLESPHMTLRVRRIFFWLLIPCFLIGGAATVLYSQGYRIDAKSREVTKIGALFVRGYPRSATITLDGKPLNTGSWWPLQSGTLDGGLVPGTYQLHAEAPGYRTWDADVVIRPSLVTERKSLILFPDIATPVPFASSVFPVAIDTPDTFDDPVIITDDDDSHVSVGDAVFPGVYIGSVRDRLALISSIQYGKTVSTLITLQAPNESTATTFTVPATSDEWPLVFDDSILVRENGRVVAAYDGATGKRSVFASSLEGKNIGAYLRTGSFDAWEVRGTSTTELVIRRRGTTSQVTIATKGIISLDPAGSSLGVLDEAGSLWLVNPNSGTRQEIGHRAGYASWKDDGTAVAAVIDGGIEVIPLTKEAPHGKIPGTIVKGDDVDSIDWYPDGEHLFVVTRNTTQDILLFVDVVDGGTSEQHAYTLPLPDAWSYSAKQGTLFVVNQGTVQSYVFPN